MKKSLERVAVVGPPDVATAAASAVSAYISWSQSLLGMGRLIVSPPPVQPLPPIPLPSGEFLYRWMLGNQKYELFRVLASRALESADSYSTAP
jgi:hypothetical protein